MEKKYFLLIFYTILINNILKTCSSRRIILNPTTDQESLIAFKNTVTFSNGEEEMLVKNWSINSSVCVWAGVYCNPNQRVTALNFSAFHLHGTIAPHLGNLSFLRSLDLSFNNLSGSLPPQLSNLRRLRLLNLGVNLLSGEIPTWLGALPELEGIQLYNNSFSGSLPQSLFNTNGSKLQAFDVGNNFLGGNIPQEIGNLSSMEVLNLGHNDFTGSVPRGLFNMSSLRDIYLRSNNLSGWLPDDLCENSNPKLRTLVLSVNKFSGPIPANIYKCVELENLLLPYNNFDGNIPVEIGRLTKLAMVFIGYNNFSGSIPKQIGNLTALKQLHVGTNKLTGELPEELSNIKLEKIGVGENSLSGPIPQSFFNISTLQLIDLSNNHFSGSLPTSFGSGLPNLQELYLDNNRLNGPIPSSITNASMLALMDLGSNSLSGPLPNFDNLRFLQAFIIAGNNLTSSTRDLSFISSFSTSPYLKYLELSGNQLRGVLPPSVGNLSALLQYFGASTCDLYGTIPHEMGNLSGLLTINLERNNLSGNIPIELGDLTSLQGLNLDNNRLQGYIPRELCRLTNLVNLYLYNNALVGSIPECFGDIKSLRKIYLGNNMLNSTVPPSLYNLKDLVALGLSSNYLTGNLASDIGNLKVVLELNFSFNQFSGEIPSSIGGCQSLEFLSLANNELEGSIPDSLGNIKSLVSLDLTSNNLSGSIPESLADLLFLSYFNVSNNDLEGEIPTGGQFGTFTDQSFLHNKGLCGPNRLNFPLCVEAPPPKGRRAKTRVSLLKYILPPVLALAVIIMIVTLLLLSKKRKSHKTPQHDDPNNTIGVSWRRITRQELVRGTDRFSDENLIGRGSYGSVFKGTLLDGSNVAVKVFKTELEGGDKSFNTETKILGAVRHRNLVKIIGCCSNNMDFKALVLSYMPNGSLEDWLYGEDHRLDLRQRLSIALDVALALEYLHHGHEFVVVHCDIKPSNVLIDEDMTARVGDFGISKLFEEGEGLVQTQTLATIGYSAPEYASDGKVSTSGDVYSYGILLLEMFTRRKPTDDMFDGGMSMKDWVGEALLRAKGDRIFETVDPHLAPSSEEGHERNYYDIKSVFDLAMRCLAASPEQRINMREVTAALQKIKDGKYLQVKKS